MNQVYRYLKSLITLGLISGTFIGTASVIAQELPPHNLASSGKEYVTHTNGILPIVQPYRNVANINDAYLVLNGKTIPAQYDFILRALVFLPQYEVDIADGLQQGNIVIDSHSGDLIHQPIQFYFDGSDPIPTIYNEGGLYRVVVEDPDGFTSVEVKGSGIRIPPVMTWEKPQTRVEFNVEKTSTKNRIEVIAKKPVRRFDPLLLNLNEHRANLVDIDSLPFNQLRNEAINAQVCENEQECPQDNVATVLANVAANINALLNRFERLPTRNETAFNYGMKDTRLQELRDFLGRVQNNLQEKDFTEAERQRILTQIRQIS
ncbi:hypothetical protein, partial [Calothrix rhizosoleniae]|uniref:hypothetical protein n=1 Tax=Calothrix rhizosoleniae TaxID=888997 RepID=UPI00117839C2